MHILKIALVFGFFTAIQAIFFKYNFELIFFEIGYLKSFNACAGINIIALAFSASNVIAGGISK